MLHQCQPARLWPPWTLRAGEYIDAILWQSHRQLDAAIHNAITGLYRLRLLWWLLDDGIYAAEGVFGQFIVIDANRDLIVVLQRLARRLGVKMEAHALTFIQALSDYVVEGN